jgi:Eukaryotic protein of unknown function (DUF842)
VCRCQECQRPVAAAEQVLQQQLQGFQARLQRCAERCQDEAQVQCSFRLPCHSFANQQPHARGIVWRIKPTSR